MAITKHITLVDRLLKMSHEGKIDWKTAPIDDSFQVAFKDSGVVIRKTSSRRSPSDYRFVFELLNSDGLVVDSFDDEELDDFVGGVESRYYKRTRDLFELARRKALGADNIMDEVLKELDNIDDEIPF